MVRFVFENSLETHELLSVPGRISPDNSSNVDSPVSVPSRLLSQYMSGPILLPRPIGPCAFIFNANGHRYWGNFAVNFYPEDSADLIIRSAGNLPDMIKSLDIPLKVYAVQEGFYLGPRNSPLFSMQYQQEGAILFFGCSGVMSRTLGDPLQFDGEVQQINQVATALVNSFYDPDCKPKEEFTVYVNLNL